MSVPRPDPDAPPVTSGAVDPVTHRVLAPNPGPMTLDGTNTWLLGAPGHASAVVVDPGPDLPEHRRAVEAALAATDREACAVVVTHHHVDHAEAAGWAGVWGVPLHAFDPGRVPGARPLADGAVLDLAGLRLTAVHTPGHVGDHLCLRVDDTGVVLSGDHVLGRGTTVVAWPDGDMAAYRASLHRLAGLHATRLDPGHGPSLDDPAGTVAAYLVHRREREAEILRALGGEAATTGELTARVYADVDPALHGAAERSLRAHLAQLAAEGRVVVLDDGQGPAARVRAARFRAVGGTQQ